VLQLLVDGRSQHEIATRLFITPKTVATHIQRILAKLNVHSRAQAVALAAKEDLFARAS
jgi:DNA-binding NarL/FixJ family response regulator